MRGGRAQEAKRAELLLSESLEREAQLRLQLADEKRIFRSRLAEYESLCHSLEECLRSSKVLPLPRPHLMQWPSAVDHPMQGMHLVWGSCLLVSSPI